MDKPSGSVFLAVLPFRILSEKDRTRLYCDGLVMDLVTDLSRFGSFQVLGYQAAVQLAPTSDRLSPTQELPVDYWVYGMARDQQGKLLLNIQLIRSSDNRLVWGDKFEGSYEELFQFQGELVEKLVASLQQLVDYDLYHGLRKKKLTSLHAYECWLSGYQELKKGTLEADEQARVYFRQAMEVDPDYARAYTGMSLTFFNEWSCQLWTRWEVSQNGAYEWARKALALDEWDYVSNAILGRVYLFQGEYEKAEHYLRKSLQINANDVETLTVIATGLVYLGHLNEARALYDRACRLHPAHSFPLCGFFILFEMGHWDEALELAGQHEADSGWVDFHAFMAATYFAKGEIEAVRNQWALYLKQFSAKIQGGASADTPTALKWMMDVNPYKPDIDTPIRAFWAYMMEVTPLDIPDEHAEQPPAPGANRWTHTGDWWVVSYAGKQVNLPDLKGLHDLACLLARAGEEIHCTELMGVRILQEGTDVLDERARNSYRRKLVELKEAMEEADMLQDQDRLNRLHREYDQMMDHLSSAIRPDGRSRQTGSSVEKARTAVTWRIRSAIKKVSAVHPPLADHLQRSVKTGNFCAYKPEHEMHWEL